MFPNSIISELLNDARMKSFIFASNKRKDETAKRLDYFHDEQNEYTLEILGKHFSNPEKMQLVCLNVVKKVIRNLAQVYRDAPKRTVEGTEKDQAIFEEIMDTSAMDVRMKQASRYAKLLKTIMLRPVWRNGRLDLDVLTGDVLDVATGDTPEDLQAVLVTHDPKTKSQEITYSRWTAEKVETLDWRYRVTEEQPNPYGVIPFVPVFDYAPTSDFWLPGGADLISLQEAINSKLTDLLYVIRHQGFGVGYIKGSGMGGGLHEVDPGTLIGLPEDGEIGFESQEAEIDAVLNAVEALIKQTAVTNGLSAAILATDPSQASGVSKLADSKELTEMRQDDTALFRRYEKQLFEIVRVVWNAHNPTRKISDTAKLVIDFADLQPTVSPKEQAETWNLLLDMGVVNSVDIIMERNPDLKSRDDAKEYLIQLQEERRELES